MLNSLIFKCGPVANKDPAVELHPRGHVLNKFCQISQYLNPNLETPRPTSPIFSGVHLSLIQFQNQTNVKMCIKFSYSVAENAKTIEKPPQRLKYQMEKKYSLSLNNWTDKFHVFFALPRIGFPSRA